MGVEGVDKKRCTQKFPGLASSSMFTTQCNTLTHHLSGAGALEWGTGVHGGGLERNKDTCELFISLFQSRIKTNVLSGTDTTVYGI